MLAPLGSAIQTGMCAPLLPQASRIRPRIHPKPDDNLDPAEADMDRIEPQQNDPRPDNYDITTPADRTFSRRHFVRRVGLGGAALAVAGPVLAACGTTKSSTSSSGSSASKPTGNRLKIGF